MQMATQFATEISKMVSVTETYPPYRFFGFLPGQILAIFALVTMLTITLGILQAQKMARRSDQIKFGVIFILGSIVGLFSYYPVTNGLAYLLSLKAASILESVFHFPSYLRELLIALTRTPLEFRLPEIRAEMAGYALATALVAIAISVVILLIKRRFAIALIITRRRQKKS